jgi:hypothetical protein
MSFANVSFAEGMRGLAGISIFLFATIGISIDFSLFPLIYTGSKSLNDTTGTTTKGQYNSPLPDREFYILRLC